MTIETRSKFVIFILFIVWLHVDGQKGECNPPATNTYLHIAHTRTGSNPHMDGIIESINYENYDMLWLGGDMAFLTSADDETMMHVDSILDVGNENTLWALGNHDYTDLIKIQAYTNRPPYFAYYKNGITFIVLDTQDSLSNIIGQQKDFFESVVDTIQNSSHLIVLHHQLIWMYDNPDLEPLISSVANGGFGSCISCINPNNFNSEIYPRLLEVKQKGIEVICIAGDIGFRVNEFEYLTTDGIQYLASGIEAGSVNNKALLFCQDTSTNVLTWEYKLIADLLVEIDTIAPLLNSISISPDTINGGDTITVTLCVEDEVSGIDTIQVDIVNPNGEQIHTVSEPIENWTSLENEYYSCDVEISDMAMIGEWYVSAISVHDNEGNILCLDAADSTLATFFVNEFPESIREIENDLTVFPNPSSGIVYISKYQNIESVYVFNHMGMTIEIDDIGEKGYIDLSHKPKGLYVLRFVTKNNIAYVTKVIIGD